MEKIVIGYFAAGGYMGLILLLQFLLEKRGMDKEVARKTAHLFSFGEWIICYFLFGPSIHLFIFNAVGAALLVPFVVITGKREGGTKRNYGIMYFAVSTAIVLVCPIFVDTGLYILTGVAYFALALGDGLAPLTARMSGKFNAVIFKNKTVIGTFTVFAVTSLVACAFSAVFGLNYDPLFIIALGAGTCMAELFGSRGLDNLWVEFAVFGLCVMQYYGLMTAALEAALITSPPMLAATAMTRAFTPSANIVSFLYFVLASFFAGMAAFVTILVSYSIEFIGGKIARKIAEKRSGVKREKHPRNYIQILANSAVSLIFFILYYFLENKVMLYCAFAALAEEIADSLASDIGKLSRRKPVDILKFKRIETGVSGGVSVLGCLSAACGALLVAGLPFAFYPFGVLPFSMLAVIAFFGTFVDSALGSGIQKLFRCTECGALTEAPQHCGVAAARIKGLSFIDNSMVNLLTSVVTGLIALLVFFLI